MHYLRVLFAAGMALLSVVAYAQSASDVYIYRGGDLSQDGITLGSWGGGKAGESKEKILTGSHSIKITTQGFYSGGRLDFTQPVTLYTDAPEKNQYVQFAFYFDDIQKVDHGATSNYEVDIEPFYTPKATKMRFVFVSDRGSMVAVEKPTDQIDRDDNWMRIAVPLTKLTLPEGSKDFRLSRVIISSDLASSFYLGEMKLVVDNVPLTADISGIQVFGVNETVYFLGTAMGGVSTLKYSWDYDATNGVQPESTGMVGSYTYKRGGDFTLTLTVTDYDGVKEPATATYKISVND